MESFSQDTIAQAVVKKAKELKIKSLKVKKFKSLTGFGVEGEIWGKKYYVGKLLNEKDDFLTAKKAKSEGKTVVYVYEEEKVLGAIVVADMIKNEAATLVGELKKSGIDVYMITGDNRQTALTVGKEIGISEENIFAQILPKEKEKIVRMIKNNINKKEILKQVQDDKQFSLILNRDKENKVVGFVGDGVNDAPVLATSDVGIALSTGTDIAMETASVTIVNKNLLTVLKAINLSKKTLRTIKLNLFWAFVYNVILIPVAITGKINPILASAAMAFSSISVVVNSLLLKRIKI